MEAIVAYTLAQVCVSMLVGLLYRQLHEAQGMCTPSNIIHSLKKWWPFTLSA